MIEAIIFDFDGVILESTDIKIKAFRKIYEPYGQEITQKVIDYHLKNGGISRVKKIKYFHKNFLHKQLTNSELNHLATIFSNAVTKEIKTAKLVKGVKSFLENNYKKYNFFISSGTPDEELKTTVKLHQIDKYFIDIFGSPTGKVEHIKNILQKYNLFPQNVCFIGDAPLDKTSANQTNINFIARITENSQLQNEIYKIADFTEIENVIQAINLSDLIC